MKIKILADGENVFEYELEESELEQLLVKAGEIKIKKQKKEEATLK